MDTITNITRNRNTYTIDLDTGKHIVAYLEPPFRVIGVSGRELTNAPKQIDGRIGNAFIDAATNHCDLCNREYIDRIISLPDIAIAVKVFAINCIFYSEWGEIHTMPEWKNTLALLRKWSANPDTLPNEVDYLDNVIGKSVGRDTLEKYGLTDFADYIPVSLYPYINSCKAFRSALRTAAKDRFAEPQAKIKELFGMDSEDEICRLFGVRFYRYSASNEINHVCRKMTRIVDFINKIGLDDYKVENLDRSLADLEARWHAERTARDNRTFRTSQTTHNLYYENDRYYTRVPLDRTECKEIGDHFCNCVNTIEWDNYLRSGDRYLVVVCDKVTNEMLVCVDIIPRTMHINQYYGYRNSYIEEPALLHFKSEYQDYLNGIV